MRIKAAVLSGAAEPVEVRDVGLEEPHARGLQYLYWPGTMGDIVEAVR
jgi:hypothetical protein